MKQVAITAPLLLKADLSSPGRAGSLVSPPSFYSVLQQTQTPSQKMNVRSTNRRRIQGDRFFLGLLLPLLLLPVPCVAQQETQAPAPIERRSPPTSASNPAAANPAAASHETNLPRTYAPQANANAQRRGVPPLPRGEHLAQWMSQHSNLTPEQQQEALGHEPGFGNLPSETQQRYRERLAQLDALNPQKRERFLARTEAMERLTLDQRAEVRGAMSQLGALPPDQRRAVAQTFRALRDLPPNQRVNALNSGRYGPPLDNGQRAVIFGLLQVEPMLPPPAQPQRGTMNPGSQAYPGMQPAPQMPR